MFCNLDDKIGLKLHFGFIGSKTSKWNCPYLVDERRKLTSSKLNRIRNNIVQRLYKNVKYHSVISSQKSRYEAMLSRSRFVIIEEQDEKIYVIMITRYNLRVYF